MKRDDSQLRLSASDLATFVACAHATHLSAAVATGQRPPPPYFPDPSMELLRARGHSHEAAYLAQLRVSRSVEEISPQAADAAGRTAAAMRRGDAVIYQGTLVDGPRWLGRPDFLVRVETPSNLGGWSYEAADAKLARSAKAGALLQLCFYSELLRRAQGVLPGRMTLVLGDMREEHFATARYASYFRHARTSLERALLDAAPTYPEPVAHCDVCDFAVECSARRRADDHLSLVAGITGSQRRALEQTGVRTLRDLATLPLVQPSPVDGIGSAAFVRIREQARIQVEGADGKALRYEILDVPAERELGHGLEMLPPPSTGDLFIDFEGDPYALGDGLEYLLGLVEASPGGAPTYQGLWAFDRDAERAAFERFVALVTERRARYPEMHLYHYNHYEPTALKRLAGRYATCVDELDALLRGRVFVDLYQAVRQSVRASVESYSIKRLEPLFGFERGVALRDANRCLAMFEAWMELRETAAPSDIVRDAIQGYNRDDCLSAMGLRDWLETLRRDVEKAGEKGAVILARPPVASDEAPPKLTEELERVRAAATALLAGVPTDPEARSPDDRARYVLANLLEWHRREDKSSHWEYFRLCDLKSDDAYEEDGTALGGLTYVGVVDKVKRSLVHRYRFPPQDHAIDRARDIHDPATKKAAGTLVALDHDAGVLDIKRDEKSTVPHPRAVIPGGPVPSHHQRASLLRLGEQVVAHGLTPARPLAAALALLRREPPPRVDDGSTIEETAVRRALAIDGSVLPVQGPPGTGKTYLGARMIVALLRAGKRVGITANSHKVMTNLLDEACAVARQRGTALRAVQKCDGDDGSADAFVRVVDDNKEVVRLLENGEANVVVGTAWLWARTEMAGAVDVLFVDEAGQMSLANVLASAPASNGLVLLGDPQQLDQPLKGVHPPGTAVSVLGHVLGGRTTIGADQGMFLDETWRMHPDVCGFVSEVFYEGRLRSRAGLAGIRLDSAPPWSGTGLRFVPALHRGNQSASPEEVEVVANLVAALLAAGSTWTDSGGVARPLLATDVLVVSPYNAQVGLLRKRLPEARVGTVDKFQGQQAAVVIYSMATSSPEDAPRGMEFLYSGNRFNVAVSRARCAAFVVANPALFDVRCQSERQMRLVNTFCRFLEMAAPGAGRQVPTDGRSRVNS